MKKTIFLLAAILGLTGCSVKSGVGGTSGKVDCYSIKVIEGGTTIVNSTYSATYSSVYEYKTATGNKIYTNYRIRAYDSTDCKIRAYSNRYKNDYVDYSYSRFVGFLTKENNYYLDLGARTIDSETKWSEYKYENDPTDPPAGAKSNNKEAYSCAKSNYYQVDSYSSGNDYYILRLDLTESNLQRHVYTMLGEDSVITYTAKWF